MNYIYKGKTEFEYEINYELDESYGSSLRKLHPEITWLSIIVGSYQGDIISIGYDKENNWYYKMNSYGSCSGCDWIQGINTQEGAEEFYKSQENIDKLGKDIEYVKQYLTNETKNVYDFQTSDLEELFYFIDNKKEQER